MPNPELVTAQDLDQWAATLSAQSLLPRLVRRLILANASISQLAMRAGEGIIVPGWDGLVEAGAGDAYVPPGTSRWEMSTGDPGDKAQDNYRKRTRDPLGVDPRLTTFVFVSPRRWPGRDAWVQTRKAEGRWADVRAYDADDLETWLEQSPSVHIWISELFGRDPRDVKTIDSWWESWSSQTSPPLSAPFVLAGRDDLAIAIASALREAPRVIQIVAQSREEATACAVAAILESELGHESLAARAVVVSGQNAWERILDASTPLVLIPIVDDVDVTAASAKGHHVIAPMSDRIRPRGAGLSVVPLDQQKAADALIAEGVAQENARRLARQGRRSLLSLRRTIAANPLVRRPGWSESPSGGRLASLVLVGSWNENNDSDGKAVEAATGRTYPDVEVDLAAWSAEEDAPISHIGRHWQIVAKDDCWELISPLLTQTDVERFETTITSVLREENPALGLGPDKRWMAGVLGANRQHSNTLREGLADSLAFLGGFVGELTLPTGITGQQLASHLVRKILDGANSDVTQRHWPSLTDVLPVIAEAAPDAFLDAVEGGLSGDPPPLSALFPEEDYGPFGGPSFHVGLVWALQNLCWSPDYLSRAIAVLSRLMPLDTGNRTGPHPADALAQALNLFLPQTSAPLSRRLAVIDGLRRRQPDAAWKVMLSLLPSNLGILNYAHTPRWRTWHHGVSTGINHSELSVGIAEVVERLLADVDRDIERWTQLIPHASDLPLPDRERLIRALESLDASEFDEAERAAMAKVLTSLVHKHRRFPGAQWAMPAEATDRFDGVARAFAPLAPRARHVELFGRHPYLADVDNDDFPVYDAALRERRLGAVADVAEAGGLQEILELGREADDPVAVGIALGNAGDVAFEDDLLANLGTAGSDGLVAIGYAAGHVATDGVEWIVNQLDRNTQWTAVQRAMVLLAPPRINRAILDLLEAEVPEVGEEFWRRVQPRFSEVDAKASIARSLLDRGRPLAAADVLATLVLQSGAQTATERDAALVVEALLAAATQPEDIAQVPNISWEAGQLLDFLEQRQHDQVVLARLEFLYLPLLQHTRPARALARALQLEPSLFVELVSYIVPEEGQTPPEVTEQQQRIAMYGFNALRAWNTPPGITNQGEIDDGSLRAWVTEARTRLAEVGRTRVGDQMIGEALAHLPSEEDGLWPPGPLREMIEDLESLEFEGGLEAGRFNSRGVQSRAIDSGGRSERGLAEMHREWASRVVDEFPRTAAMLRRIADTYESWGRHEDHRSAHYLDEG